MHQVTAPTFRECIDLDMARSESSFTYRLAATDGGLPFDFIAYPDRAHDGASVYRGDDDLATAPDLDSAWDDYLYAVSPGEAPVNAAELEVMWAAFDAWKDTLPNTE